MRNGCVFEPDYNSTKCTKYNIMCHGSESSKRKCPEWGQVIAYEEYLAKKLELEANQNFNI